MIPHTAMSSQSLNMKMHYEGVDVDGGAMHIEDVVTALQGFSGAYGKVANSLTPSTHHELRLAAVEKGSFNLSIVSFVSMHQKEIAAAMPEVVSAARYVFGIIKDVIESKRHVKGKPYEISIQGSNNAVVVINADGATLAIPKEVAEILKDKMIDSDLSKITSPLSEGRVDIACLSAMDDEGSIETTISSEEKSYFDADPDIRTSSEVEIQGSIVSLNKETLRGTFKLSDGSKIQFRYVGENPEGFFPNFSHKGLLRVSAVAFFDDSLTRKRLEITKAIHIQELLPFHEKEQN